MATYSDNLEFNEAQLNAAIALLEQVHAALVLCKNKYIDTVNTQLSPNWTTTGGQETVTKLNAFAENDIQSFITYMQNRIDDMKSAAQNVAKIDIA